MQLTVHYSAKILALPMDLIYMKYVDVARGHLGFYNHSKSNVFMTSLAIGDWHMVELLVERWTCDPLDRGFDSRPSTGMQ